MRKHDLMTFLIDMTQTGEKWVKRLEPFFETPLLLKLNLDMKSPRNTHICLVTNIFEVVIVYVLNF